MLVYTDSFDDGIYSELRRQYRVINHSLSALFLHSPQALNALPNSEGNLEDTEELEEVVTSNILNEDPDAEEDHVKRISDYIRISVAEEDSYTFIRRVESYYYEANKDTLFRETPSTATEPKS